MDVKALRVNLTLRLLVVPAILIVVAAILSAWHGSSNDRAEAASGGPEMDMSVELADTTTCPGGTPAGTVCVMAGNQFTLRVNAVGIPGAGYILAQSFIDYGTFNPAASEDGAGPNTCNDAIDNGGGDGADRFDSDCATVTLVYKPGTPVSEVVWPDVEPATVLRSELGPGLVGHGGLTGLISPPASFYIGTLVQIEFNCSASSSTTLIKLLPEGDAVAGTSGALYTAPPSTKFVPKVNDLSLRCVGPTPTPTNTPIPPTNTPTNTPTPTNSPTPLPPPSERPDVKITKVDLVDPVSSGATIEYGVVVESIGLQTAEDVVVEDVLPPGSVFKKVNSSVPATCGEAAGVVTCQLTNPMPPSAIALIQIVINAPVGTDSLIDNNVTVTSSNEPFANTGNNKDIEQTMVLAPRSDVTLTKTGEPTFLEGGENVIYTLVAKNLGPDPAVNVQIVDTLPNDATLVSATNPECGPEVLGEVTCDLGNLGVNQEAIVEIEMTAPNVTRNTFLKNVAVVSADNESFKQSGNNLAIENTAVIAPPPDLVVTKTDSQDPVLRRGLFSYEIVIDNIGLGDALDVVVTDTLPTVLNGPFNIPNTMGFISASGASCAEGPPGVVVCDIPEINVGQQAIITLDVRANTLLVDQTAVNSVTVSASDPDENPAGNDDSESTLVRACFDTNGDLFVDLANDILGTILHALTYEGDPGYDPVYDFDGDGYIGLAYDILPVILHYFQDCSLLL